MKVTEFLERGGDLSLLELKELSSPIADVSYLSLQGDGETNNMNGSNTVLLRTVLLPFILFGSF